MKNWILTRHSPVFCPDRFHYQWVAGILFLALVLPLMVPGNADAAQSRFALVIGNGAYVDGRLRNPVNDARLMTETLVSRGFQVTTLENATRRQMKEAIRDFSSELDEQSVGLFYFAGHGIEFDGNNYLIPIDADIQQEADVEYESINAGRLLSSLKQSNGGLNLVILDACRNNPYARSFRSSSRGLSRMQPPSGSLIFYATEPGNVASDGQGDNGIFTRYLVDAILREDRNIENVFKVTAINVSRATNRKQIPYIEGVLLGDFYFNGGKTESTSPVTETPVTARAETLFWRSVMDESSAEMFQAYINSYPDGLYTELARLKLASISEPLDQSRPAQTGVLSTPASAKVLGRLNISGQYQSRLSGQSKVLDTHSDFLAVTINQDGNQISGSFGNLGGEIEGEIDGDTIRFDWYSSWSKGKGEWRISPEGDRLEGSWWSVQYDRKGKWDLYPE